MSNVLDFLKKYKFTSPFFLLFLILLFLLFATTQIGVDRSELSNDSVNDDLKIPFTDVYIDVKSTSLLIAAIVIGLLDGFNPCAMWVLIYLITLVSGMNRSKMWFIVGTFLLSSGVLYFIILAGWLNLFSFIGYSKWVMFAIGAFAIWTGAYAIYDFYRSGGNITCDVGDIKSRKRTMNKIKEIVESPITAFSILAVIALAFAINSIEFFCSAGLPALFSSMLAIADISTLTKYFYILVYTLAFMADDLLIFSLALMAIDSEIMHKYSGLTKIIGGIIMVGIGIVLLFFPELLV